MKFLVFNLAVTAALVFLFTADRGDVQKMAGQVHDAAADVKAYAQRTLNSGKKKLDTSEGSAATAPAPIQQTSPATPARPVPEVDPAPARKTPPPAAAPPQPLRTADVATKSKQESDATLKPEVAQRRQEILDGVAPAAQEPRLKDGAKLMSATDRRKELLSLAEEMELLYARSISR
jgi:hypothetical protein